MESLLDSSGLLDLSGCYKGIHCDFYEAVRRARKYYFENLIHLTAWDGTLIWGMEQEDKFIHLIAKHGVPKRLKDNHLEFLPCEDYCDIQRMREPPLIKRAVQGELPIDIYLDNSHGRKKTNKKADQIEVVVSGEFEDYIVVLGSIKNFYIIRSAYHANKGKIKKIEQNSSYIGSLGSI